MKTAIRCETCRWFADFIDDGESDGEEVRFCRRFPPTHEDGEPFGCLPTVVGSSSWCGEWAHDPRRFYEVAGGIFEISTKEVLPVLWPWWVEEEAPAGPNAHLEGE